MRCHGGRGLTEAQIDRLDHRKRPRDSGLPRGHLLGSPILSQRSRAADHARQMAANVAKRLWEIDDIWTTQGMMEILGAIVVIGVFVFWCDVTDGWGDVHRRIRALLPPYSK